MKFTLSWLKDHLETDAPLDVIVEKLTAVGLEVEEVHDPAKDLAPFIVGHVVEAGPHPNADRLKVCRVDTGAEVIQVVCGAPNARQGLKVALARPGDRIPDSGEVLKKGKIRDVESQGMMCSWRELGLGSDHSGIIELPDDAAVGAKLTSVVNLDPVIEVAITPNRMDCLGVRGIARDLAAAGLGTLKPLDEPAIPGTFASPVGVALEHDGCPMFVGRYVRGVKNGDSPQWLKDRLEAVGLRPISALVDITNYVTVDRGRPLHVFDAAKLSGSVRARPGRPGETLLALNGKTYDLDADMVVIADDARALGLGGIMGGEDEGATAETTDVFVESALFDAVTVANTGRRLAIDSDARYRFERGVDPQSAVWGCELATRLILDLCGGEPSELVVAGAPPAGPGAIAVRPERVAALGGVDLSRDRVVEILRALAFTVEDTADGRLAVVPPSWRLDVTEEHDVVEEVIRIHGYDTIPAEPLPRSPMPPVVLTPRQRQREFARRTLATRGMMETVTWSFMARAHAELFGFGDEALVLSNPISSDLDTMRPSVLPNLIQAAGRNAARGYPDVALFEVGPDFQDDTAKGQRLVAAGVRAGRTGPRNWVQAPRAVDAFDAKADALAALEAAGCPVDNIQVTTDAPGWYHPGRSGALRLGPTVLAWFGEIHPRVLKGLDVKGTVVGFEVFLEAVPQPKTKGGAAAGKTRPLLRPSPFQPLERDFAFVVDADTPAEKLIRAAKGADRKLITEVRVFDVYQGDTVGAGRKSLALSITLQPQDRTLTDEDLDKVTAAVVAAVEKATGATLRS